MSYEDWEPTIGLEIHAQLKTNSKIFSSDSAAFGGGDNEHVSILSLGLPGALPTLNKQVVTQAVRAGLALNCEINLSSRFSRKSYFYPDMPKGYQITQFEEPICGEGFVDIFLNGNTRKIRIERAHLEEDAGKSTHHGQYTLINLNRSGVPLLEIVSKPDMSTAEEAAEYSRMVRKLLRYVDVCDGNLEEGSLRVDCNVSVKKRGDEKFGTKVEIKNLNSFRFIEKAVDYEINRQIESLESGVQIVQETRLFDSTKVQTFPMRSKEEADDYRYFPDPDLLLCKVDPEEIVAQKKAIGERPLEKALRYRDQLEVAEEDAFLITEEKAMAKYFEEALLEGASPKSVSHWITGEVMRVLKEESIDILDFAKKVPAKTIGEIVNLQEKGEVSGKIAKQVFSECFSSGEAPIEVIERLGLKQISDEVAIESVISQVIASNPSQAEEYRGGKEKVFGFFVGQVMKETKGQANPGLVNKLLKKKLKGN